MRNFGRVFCKTQKLHLFFPITAPITEYMKLGPFTCTKEASRTFEEIKSKMARALVLPLPDSTPPFVDSDCQMSSLVMQN